MKQQSEVTCDSGSRIWQALLVGQLLIFSAVSCYSTAIQRHLYADGSNIFLMMLKGHKVTEFYPSRYFAHALTQLPAICLLRDFGCRDISLLSYVYGAGLYLVPLGCLALAWWAARGSQAQLLVYPLIASSIIFLNVSGFIISESHVAAALVWPILFLLLFSERLTLTRSILLIALSYASIRCYQSYLFLSWPLFFVSAHRGFIAWRKSRQIEATTCVVCSGFFVIAFWVALESTIKPHDPWSDLFVQHAIYHLKFPPVWFSLLVLLTLFWCELFPNHTRRRMVVRRIIECAGVCVVFMPVMGFVGPGFQYYSRVQTLYVPFVLMVAVILKTIVTGRGPQVAGTRSAEAIHLATLTCVVAAAFQIGSAIRWNEYRTLVLRELEEHQGIVNFDMSTLSLEQLTKADYPSYLSNSHPNQFNWGWAIPSLSVVLSAEKFGSVNSIILAPDYVKWQPFDPRKPKQIPNLLEYGITLNVNGDPSIEPPNANANFDGASQKPGD